ncbi:hypothetical protein AQV86_03610 [Nanohaloarchaea archaeon SG9]|nr:hypothetical protein AQV86_03610 [Nanohaloarchaea archaeon SG9]
MEQSYGLFAYEEEIRDPEEIENPETRILGEENDLPTTWQVQLHLTPGLTQEERQYLTETETENEAYTQDTLNTGVRPEQRKVGDYAAAD